MAGQHRSTPHGWLIPATVMLQRMTNIYIPQWNLVSPKIRKQRLQGSPIALAFFGLTVGAWAASSAFRPNNKDTFQDTACISIHFKASVEGCQNHPKSREFPWNKFWGIPHTKRIEADELLPHKSPTCVILQLYNAIRKLSQLGRLQMQLLTVVIQLIGTWHALGNMTSTQDVHLEREKESWFLRSFQEHPKTRHQQNHAFLPIISTLSSKDSSCDILWGNDSNGLKLKKSSFKDREISSSDWQTLRSGIGKPQCTEKMWSKWFQLITPSFRELLDKIGLVPSSTNGQIDLYLSEFRLQLLELSKAFR